MTLLLAILAAFSVCACQQETDPGDDNSAAPVDAEDDDDDASADDGIREHDPVPFAQDSAVDRPDQSQSFGDPWFDHEPTDCGESEIVTPGGFATEEDGLHRELVDGGISMDLEMVSDVVVDEDGSPTVWANKGGFLTRYTVSGSSIEVAVFASRISGNPAATIDRERRTHVVFADNRAGVLHHLENRNGEWIRTPVDCGEKFSAVDVAVDFLGSVHVSYRHTIVIDFAPDDARLFHAVRWNGIWRRTQFDEAEAYTTFMKVDERLRVGIMTQTYYRTTFHLRGSDGTWNHDVLAMGGGDSTNPHETYSYSYSRPQFEFNDRDELDWVVHFSEFWSSWPVFYGTSRVFYSTTDDVPYGAELDFGMMLELGYPAFGETTDRTPHIFFRSGLMLKHHSRDDDWSARTIALGGDNPALFIDENERMYVSHYSTLQSALKVTYGSGRIWRTRRLDRVTLAGDSAVALMDPNGDLVVLHTSDLPPGLIVDRPSGDSWRHELAFAIVNPTLADEGAAIDSNGSIHAVIYNPSAGGMQYVSNAGGTWLTESVGAGWRECALDVDPAIRVHVACASSGELHYILRDGGVWTDEAIDIAAFGLSSPYSPHIAITPGGDATILFNGFRSLPTEQREMWAVDNGSGSWQGAPVRASLDWNSHSMDIATGPDGEVRAVVSDADELWIYSRDVGTWSSVVIAIPPDGTDVVSDVSVAVDGDGANHVIYCEHCGDTGGGPLRYVSDASGDWTDSIVESSYGGDAGLTIGDDDQVRVAFTRSGSVYLATFAPGWSASDADE
ncbi:MAG: hypothetical protein IT350_06460 [Deltaproteobacteria bacterium]|nr:hypothetical protein [Deltaproteobacteria bacterium]